MPITDSISPVKSDDIGRPVGTYRVELLDRHTGKVRERYDASNYISPMLLEQLKWQQAINFHRGLRFAHLGGADQQFPATVGRRNYRASPTLPIEFIAGLTSTIAEDPTSSWGTGRVVGFASRWKTTIAAGGPRGQINEAQSEMTLDGSKVVFDFNEDQGNGTIESLAICRLAPDYFGRTSAPPSLSARVGAGAKFINFDMADIGPNYFNFVGMDWANSKILGYHQSARQIAEIDISSVVPTADGVYDLAPLTSSDVTLGPALSGLTWTASNLGGQQYQHYTTNPGVADDGAGNWIFAYIDAYSNLNIGSWVKATGARNWWTNIPSGGTGLAMSMVAASVVVIGTKAYAVGTTNYSTGQTLTSKAIHRIDLASGVVDATLPFGTDPGGNDILARGGITTDGTNLYVLTTNGGISKYTTAGVFVEAYGDPAPGSWNETGLTPWETNTGYQDLQYPAGNREATVAGFGFNSTATDRYQTANPDVTGVVNARHLSMDAAGKLWLLDGTIQSQTGHVYSIDGANVFSRTVLDAAVNKTSSSTMKWTYEITFPSEWRALSAHPAPPT